MHHIGVVADAIARYHLRHLPSPVMETPALVNAPGQHEAQTIMFGQFIQLTRHTMKRQIGWRAAQHASIRRCHRKRHQTGILRRAIAQGDIYRLAEKISIAVSQEQSQAD